MSVELTWNLQPDGWCFHNIRGMNEAEVTRWDEPQVLTLINRAFFKPFGPDLCGDVSSLVSTVWRWKVRLSWFSAVRVWAFRSLCERNNLIQVVCVCVSTVNMLFIRQSVCRNVCLSVLCVNHSLITADWGWTSSAEASLSHHFFIFKQKK